MLTVSEFCTTNLDQMGSKSGFWDDFGVSSRKGTHLWVPLFIRASSSLAVARSAGHQVLFCALRAFGFVSRHPFLFILMCFDVVLTNNTIGTSFDLD